jgi:cytochrome P450
MPAVASAVGLPWDSAVEDPVAALAQARRALGDTFVVDSAEDRYLFTFSAAGVTSFYALPEERASKGLADWRMLRRKLPDEIFVGRRTLPHQLFGRDDVAAYLAHVEGALDAALEELGPQGEFDVFDLTRRLGHRVGLASWGGPGSARGDRFEHLVEAFDALDGSESFVHPDAMAAVAASGKARELAALAVVEAEIGAALQELPGTESSHALFARVAAAWAEESGAVPAGRAGRAARAALATGVAYDVALIHVASMSNLFAALGWMLIDLVTHPADLTRVRAGDRAWAEKCALESTRLAQRSIMARYVTQPVLLDVGDARHEVGPGVTVATLLPLTNTSAAPGLESWQPERWNRRRLADPSALAAVELVTAFGHGRHTCPAQPFSLAAMTAAAARFSTVLDMEPAWAGSPSPVRGQIGGVARAAQPSPVRYRRF